MAPVLATSALRVLGPADSPAVHALLARDPLAHVFVSSRLAQPASAAWRAGQVWGYVTGGHLESLAFAGANLVLAETTPAARAAFADRAARQGRRCSSVVGRAAEVLDFWDRLEARWGPAREVRAHQPLMAIATQPAVLPDPAVQLVRPAQTAALVPASVAMFTEEVGVAPDNGSGGYTARVAEIVAAGRALARFDAAGQVMFKAEVGAVSGGVAQLQGVWVAPRWRGQGLAAPGMAAVVAFCQAHLAPVVSLYVNDYNAPARAAYRRVGFVEHGSLATVLF